MPAILSANALEGIDTVPADVVVEALARHLRLS